MLRVDQAWGLFQASVAAHDNHAAYYGVTLTERASWSSRRQVGLGWSVGLVDQEHPDRTRRHDQHPGRLHRRCNPLQHPGPGWLRHGANTIFGGTATSGAYQSVGFGVAPDTVFGHRTAAQQQLVQTWGLRGGYTHNWNPYWNSSIYGAYAAVMYNDTSKPDLRRWRLGGTVRTAWSSVVTTCNPDYNIAQLGFITRWTPVKNLTFAAEVTYPSGPEVRGYGGGCRPPLALASRQPSTSSRTRTRGSWLLRAQRNW